MFSTSDIIALNLYLALCALAAFSQILVLVFYTIYIKLSINFACRLIVFISLIDSLTWFLQLFYSVFRVVTHRNLNQDSPTTCGVLAYISNLLMLLTLIFTLLIPMCVYIQVLYRKDPSRYEKYYYLFSFAYAFLFSSLPFAFKTEAYNQTDFRCWIKTFEMRIISFYFHLFLGFSLGVFFLIRVLRTLRQEIFKDLERTLIHKLSWIPFICLIFWLEPAIYRFISGIEYSEHDIWHFLVMPLQGFANALAYGNINDTVRKKIVAFFKLDFNELKKNNTGASIAEDTPQDREEASYNSYSKDSDYTDLGTSKKFEVEIKKEAEKRKKTIN